MRPASFGKDKKEMAVQILRYNEGWTNGEISEFLGISSASVSRYSIVPKDPERLKEFEQEFMHAIKAMQYAGIAEVNKRLLELLPKERRISEVVKAGEFYQGKSTNSNVQVNIANVLTDDRDKYNLDG